MTGLQLALTSGILIGAASALLAYRLAPSDPDLRDVLHRLAPDHQTRRPVMWPEGPDVLPPRVDRIGGWALRTLPEAAWAGTPHRDLAILQTTQTRFYGEKVIWSALGLILVPALSGFFTFLGIPIPVVVPTGGSLLLAAAGWFVPNYNAIDDAKRARIEFRRALGAYIELVALERRSSAPWESLSTLASELDVPELHDLADIMQESGQDGAQIYASLRARASALRSAMLSAEVGKANAASERMYIPASLLGVVFMTILITPALLRFTT